jgi:putative salt-induced outer membrane protein YdiY
MRAAVLIGILTLGVASRVFAQDAPPRKPWNSSMGAGLAVTSGNSDTQNINLAFNTLYDPKTVHLFKADALYLRGEANDEKQVDKATASARYERSVSERTFWFGDVSYLRDEFKAIDYLIAPIAGAGYHVIKTDTHKLSFDAGVGAAIESNRELGRDTSGAVKAGESFEWSLSPVSKVTQRLNGLWKADDFDDALYHFDVGLATTIATRAELKLSYVLDYKNKPPLPEIEKGDSALFATLLFRF